jgi:hypothetical protein
MRVVHRARCRVAPPALDLQFFVHASSSSWSCAPPRNEPAAHVFTLLSILRVFSTDSHALVEVATLSPIVAAPLHYPRVLPWARLLPIAIVLVGRVSRTRLHRKEVRS